MYIINSIIYHQSIRIVRLLYNMSVGPQPPHRLCVRLICLLIPTYIVRSVLNLSVSPHLELCQIERLSFSPCHYPYHLHGSIYAH